MVFATVAGAGGAIQWWGQASEPGEIIPRTGPSDFLAPASGNAILLTITSAVSEVTACGGSDTFTLVCASMR